MGTFKQWLGGMISASSGAMAGAFGASFAAPDSFNIYSTEGRMKLVTVAIFAMVPAVLSYLAKSPLPGVENKDGRS